MEDLMNRVTDYIGSIPPITFSPVNSTEHVEKSSSQWVDEDKDYNLSPESILDGVYV